METPQQRKRQKPIIMYRAVFQSDPDDMHLFDTHEKAVAMLGLSPGRVAKVEVREVETMVYQERG